MRWPEDVHRTIWKFPIEITDSQQIDAPIEEIISVGGDADGILCVWAVVRPDEEPEPHTVFVFGTGNREPSDALQSTFLGRVVAGPFVWHVFWRAGEP